MPNHKKAAQSVSSRGRTIEFQEPLERILIVTEGKETEPNYFDGLIAFHRLKTVSLQIRVIGTGFNTRSLVDEAQKKQNDASFPYDEIWCVFDRDDFPSDDFDNAVAKTQAITYLHAAWSNESFELWYVLHFQNHDLGVGRKNYIDKLHKLVLTVGLQKYDKNSTEMYRVLFDLQPTAISNAHKLLARCDKTMPFHARKPATAVVHLVERLLRDASENRFKSKKT